MKNTKKEFDSAKAVFLKSFIYTVAAISLLVIGYFSAEYFFSAP